MRVHFEKISRSPSDSFACRRFRGPVFICPYHQHPEIEILYMEKSRGRTVIGDTGGTFRPGQLYLFAPHVPHLFHNIAAPARRGAAWSSYIQFLPDCLGPGFWHLPETRSISALLARAARGIVWEGASSREAALLLEAVLREQGPVRIARLIDLLARLTSLPGARLIASHGYRPELHADSGRLDHALAYVNGALSGRIEAAEAARRVGLSVSGFGRFFRRHMGRPFMDYVIEQRLAEARRLLVESEFTVAEICFRCGFENLSNFNRHFRRRHRDTPTAFRRRIVSAAPSGGVHSATERFVRGRDRLAFP